MRIRVFLGWSSIVLGIIGSLFPIIPGLPFLIIGTQLIGHRDPKLRWLRVHYKLILRNLSRSRLAWVRKPARLARQAQAQTTRYLRMARRSNAGGGTWNTMRNHAIQGWQWGRAWSQREWVRAAFSWQTWRRVIQPVGQWLRVAFSWQAWRRVIQPGGRWLRVAFSWQAWQRVIQPGGRWLRAVWSWHGWRIAMRYLTRR